MLRSIAAGKQSGLEFDGPLIRRSLRAFKWSPTFWLAGVPMMLSPRGWFSYRA